MAEEKVKKAKVKSEESEENGASGEEGSEGNEDSMVKQVRQLLEDNPGGLTADGIALALGLYVEEDKASTKKNVLKKVRIYARKATDGLAAKRAGRTAIYQLDPSVESPLVQQAEEAKAKAEAEKKAKAKAEAEAKKAKAASEEAEGDEDEDEDEDEEESAPVKKKVVKKKK